MSHDTSTDVDLSTRTGRAHRGRCIIASGNGLKALGASAAALTRGEHPLDAVVAGAGEIEDDPTDVSVGFGGLPNADGIVECDACVMDGPTHAVGAVAALQDVRRASRVALDVLRHSDHSLLVGQGALAFALAEGHAQEPLLTEESRLAWRRWRDAGSPEVDPRHELLSDEDRWDLPDTHGAGPGVPFTRGTVHVALVDATQTSPQHLAACTTTSGLSYKHPGRVGDSPIVGAGIYVDHGVGSAGSTGRGESTFDTCCAFQVVRSMEEGAEPDIACLEALKRLTDRTRQLELLDSKGHPRFNVTLYALRSDGAFGGGALYSGYSMVAWADGSARRFACPFLFERPSRGKAKSG